MRTYVRTLQHSLVLCCFVLRIIASKRAGPLPGMMKGTMIMEKFDTTKVAAIAGRSAYYVDDQFGLACAVWTAVGLGFVADNYRRAVEQAEEEGGFFAESTAMIMAVEDCVDTVKGRMPGFRFNYGIDGETLELTDVRSVELV